MEVCVVSSDLMVWTELFVRAQSISTAVHASLAHQLARNVSGVGETVVGLPLTPNAYIVWRIHEEHPRVLELLELSCEKAMHNAGLRLVFEEDLCPFASVRVVQVMSNQWFLCEVMVVTLAGVLYYITLKVPKSFHSRFGLSHQVSVQRDITSELDRLRVATAFASVSQTLCIGGQNGSIFCFPFDREAEKCQELAAFELKESESGFSRLWGLSFRGKSSCPVTDLAIWCVAGVSMLFVIHADGTLRIWDIVHRSRIFNQAVAPPSDILSSTPTLMLIGDPGVSGQLQVALLYKENAEPSTETILVCSLHSFPSDGGSRPTHLTSVRSFKVKEGNVMDIRLLKNKVWVLRKLPNGSCELLSADLQNTSGLQRCRLQEQDTAEQLLQGTGQAWDDLLFALHHIGLDSIDMLDDLVPSLFLRRILQPVVRQNSALKEVLQQRSRHLTDFEISSLTVDGLRKEIRSSITTDGRNVRWSLQQWVTFCNSYSEAWIHGSRPYGLFTDFATGAVGLIRKNSVSIVRAPNVVERLVHRGTLIDFDEVALPSDWEEPARDAAVLGGLLRCMESIVGHLGNMALGLFHEALLRPLNHPLNSLVTSFLSILDVGYTSLSAGQEMVSFGVDEIRARVQWQHQRQRKFAFHMLQSLDGLREAAGSWENVLDVVVKYCRYLTFAIMSASPAAGSSSVPLGNVHARILALSASQIAWCHFEGSRNLVLLLCYFVKVQGHVGLNSDDVTRIQLQILPKVQEGLAVSLLMHWLTVSFAEIAPSEDCSLQLSSLTINGSKGNKSHVEKAGTADISLAEVLAAAFLETTQLQEADLKHLLQKPEKFYDDTWQFIGWLLLGESSEAYPLSFSGRAIQLSSILLRHGQYGGLESFLMAVEHFSTHQQLSTGVASLDGEWSARLHLLGICLLACARSALEETKKEKYIGEAIECFFRAASGLGEANKVLQSLFFVTGPHQHLPGRGAAAAWRLQYFEWVMQLFDQYNLSEGACQFAHAALEQVDEAVRASALETPDNAVGAGIKGRLWANVFKFSLDLELYGNAYCAIISNPDEGSKDICLKRLIIVLCDHKASQVLCSNELPYGRLLSRVEEELVLKAQNSEMHVKASLFKLLYALYMHHHHLGRAAGYMYMYALRARDRGLLKSKAQALHALQEELDGLAATINVLHLVDPSNGVVSGLDWLSATKRRRVSEEDPTIKRVYSNGADVLNGMGILDVEQLEKEHALTLARLQLLHADVKNSLVGPNATTSELVIMLLQHGLYETAFSIVFLFWKESTLHMELETVFEFMARNCCLLQVQAGYGNTSKSPGDVQMLLLTASDTATEDLQLSNGVSNNGRMHSKLPSSTAAKVAWEALKLYVEKYWKLYPHIRVVVAQTILSVDKQMELPLWLIDTFKCGSHSRYVNGTEPGANPAALLRIYMDHERFVEATYLLLEYLQASTRLRPGDTYKQKQACAVWVPYTLVDRLQRHLTDVSNASHMAAQCKRLSTSLEHALLQHFDHIKRESDDVKLLSQS